MYLKYLRPRLRKAMGKMTIAELHRRSTVSRSTISRILKSNGYVDVYRQDVANLAAAVGLTYEYLADGRSSMFDVQARPESELVKRVTELEQEVDKLRRHPRWLQGALAKVLQWANTKKLEIKINHETNKYEVVEESEFVLSEGDNWVEAISNAHANAIAQAEAR